MGGYRNLSLGGLGLLLAATTAIAVPPEEPARLSFDPPELNLLPGQHARVVVRVDGVPESGLAAFQVKLQFDPLAMDVIDPNAGYGVPAHAPLGDSPLCATIRRTPDCPDPEWMLSSTGRRPVGTSSLDAAQGTLTIAYGTAGDSEPPAGEGALAIVEIVAKRRIRTGLALTDAILAGAEDPPQRYSYIAPSATPRPVRPARSGRGR